jgi:DNA-binding LacI/PurR family transcriptional regulator
MTPRRVTLKDIAAKAGVSLAAASYALRPGPRPSFVSEITQRKVVRIAREMGFRVNATARSLRSSKRYSIAIVCGMLRDRSAISAAESIIAYLGNTPYAGVVAACAQVKNIKDHILRHLGPSSHDALIFIRDDRLITPELLKSLRRSGVKIAGIMPTQDDLPQMPLAYLNRPRAAAMLVEILADEGHRRIDYVLPQSAGPEIVGSIKDAAARRHVRLKSIPLNIEANDVNEFKAGVEIVRSDLRYSKASAVAVFYENLALGVVQGLSVYDIQVPNQKSVLAYGSSAVFEANEPPISGISHPIEEIGRVIAGSTIEWIEADFDPAAVRITQFLPAYVPRSTVGRIP